MKHRSYKVEIYVNEKQRTHCRKAAGTARFAYNWGLAQKKKALDEKLKVPGYYTLSPHLNAIKDVEFPWMREVSKWVPQYALSNLDRAVHDRDYNAAVNLENVAAGLTETKNACGVESSGLSCS